MKTVSCATIGVVLVTGPALAADFGPLEYLSEADSPWIGQDGYVLENFEDGLFNIDGVTVDNGSVLGPGSSTDSVDGDDGVIDGLGRFGHSFFVTASTGMTFEFDASVLGGLPTHAGIVWTDAASGSIAEFTAYDAFGGVITMITGSHADNEFTGQTAEDRFYGVEHEAGIASIHITTSTTLEVDHLQFVIPAPASAGLLIGLGLLGRRRR